jgi:hypothetical protein
MDVTQTLVKLKRIQWIGAVVFWVGLTVLLALILL